MLNHWETKQLTTLWNSWISHIYKYLYKLMFDRLVSSHSGWNVPNDLNQQGRRVSSFRSGTFIWFWVWSRQRSAERLPADWPVRLWGRQHHVNKSKPLLIRCDKFSLTDLKQTFILLTRFCLNTAQKWWYVVSISCYKPVLEIRSLTDI